MSIRESIIEVFRKNKNKWLDYGEIYGKLDKALFADNKAGDQGKKNIVYSIILGNIDIFDIDDNFRPKKFRLKSESGAISDSFIASQIKFALGESQIYVQNEKYHLIEYGLEEEYEQEIAANYKLIFGENSVYFDLKKKLGNRICDGFVYDKELRRLVIVENELFTHEIGRAHV